MLANWLGTTQYYLVVWISFLPCLILNEVGEFTQALLSLFNHPSLSHPDLGACCFFPSC